MNSSKTGLEVSIRETRSELDEAFEFVEGTDEVSGARRIPQSVKNLALNKAILASDDYPIIGEHELVTDADKEGEEGRYVEYGPGIQHVSIDLGKSHQIYAILLWHLAI